MKHGRSNPRAGGADSDDRLRSDREAANVAQLLTTIARAANEPANGRARSFGGAS